MGSYISQSELNCIANTLKKSDKNIIIISIIMIIVILIYNVY